MATPSDAPGVRRREFLKILGAAGATTAAIGCSNDAGRMVPYLVSPDQTVPGVSNYYATTCRECAAACGLLAEVRDGRTIKLEGNPDHPINHGALCARGQAALQGLYNPDRYRQPMVRENGTLVPTTWDKALALFGQKLGEARSGGKAGNAVCINQHENGSFPAFLDQWLAAYGMPPHLSVDGELPAAVIEANREAYGVAWPSLDFGAAKLIVSFAADFLETWGANVPQQLSFGDARARLADAPRFIYIGPRRSLTGLNADQWIPAAAGSLHTVAAALLGTLGRPTGVTLAQAADAAGVAVGTLEALAKELASAKPSLVLSGVGSARALEAATSVAEMNKALGNVGITIKPAEPLLALDGASTHADVRAAAERMAAGDVPLVMVRGANPAYSTPKAIGFAAAMARVPFKVSFTSYPDETSELCDLVLPDHHALESWGDAEPLRGVLSLQQPTMDPVFATRATADVLLGVAHADASIASRFPARDWRGWLIARFPGGAAGLAEALPAGTAKGGILERAARRAPATPKTPPAAAPPKGDGTFAVVIRPSPVFGEGRGANKPWLQELPDPVAKVCWQSWVEIHPDAAKKLGVAIGDLVKVETPSGSITAPVWTYLGVRPDTVAVQMGQGHTAYGRYAKGIGVNALDLSAGAEDRSGALAAGAWGAKVTRVGEKMDLVSTEGSARQHGRGIARALTVAQLVGPEEPEGEEKLEGDASHAFLPGLRSPIANDAEGDLGDPNAKDQGMYDPKHWSGMAKRRWAMTVDLARCTGCSACVTACYAENNIPTVGAPWQGRPLRPGFPNAEWDDRPGANILKGREMAWIRLERYFEGGEDGGADFETRFVPMMCQHCGNAPCEPVCPVFATYHSPDGLNVQVYNRCVGTRYCSNNCPYKVRYFNWFGYGEPDRRQYAFPSPLEWQLNPDVTVRGKGVMEKCTFCVQRIREAEHLAVLEKREVEPDEFTTACAQACPSRAITFGDAADAAWTVAAQVAGSGRRGYHVFEELNTYTGVVYLKKINHPAPGAPAQA